MKAVLIRFCVLAVGIVLTATAPNAQQADPPQRFADWQLIQFPDFSCQLVQTVVSRRTGNTLTEMWLMAQADGTGVISVRVPVGVDLAAGIAYRHPNRQAAVPLIWQMCGPDKCLAQSRITQAEMARLRKGRAVRLGFVPVPGSRPLQVSVSLMGVTAGLRAQTACKAP